MSVSYCGVPLTALGPDQIAEFETALDPCWLIEFAQSVFPGPDLLEMGFRGALPTQPVKLGSLYWPSNASRFAVGHFVASEAQLAAIRTWLAAATPIQAAAIQSYLGSYPAGFGPLVISDGQNGFPTPMYMLPARPMYRVGAGAAQTGSGGSTLSTQPPTTGAYTLQTEGGYSISTQGQFPISTYPPSGQSATISATGLPTTPPTAGFSGSAIPGLYHIVLVDCRFFWWGMSAPYLSSAGFIPGTSTWMDLYNILLPIVGVTNNGVAGPATASQPALLADTPAAAYGTPAADFGNLRAYSLLGQGLSIGGDACAPIPLLIDAAAFSCGQRMVRQLNGTVQFINATTAQTTFAQEIGAVAPSTTYLGAVARAQRLAGDVFDLPPRNALDVNRLLPSTARVNFPALYNYVSAGTHYLIDTALPVPGNGAIQVLQCAMSATFLGPDYTTPSNISALTALAAQATTDWYGWNQSGLDVQYSGAVPWVMTGIEGLVEFQACFDKVQTRVQSGPDLDYINRLLVFGQPALPDEIVVKVTDVAYNQSPFPNEYTFGWTLQQVQYNPTPSPLCLYIDAVPARTGLATSSSPDPSYYSPALEINNTYMAPPFLTRLKLRGFGNSFFPIWEFDREVDRTTANTNFSSSTPMVRIDEGVLRLGGGLLPSGYQGSVDLGGGANSFILYVNSATTLGVSSFSIIRSGTTTVCTLGDITGESLIITLTSVDVSVTTALGTLTLQYTPTTPGNWGSVPSTVTAALDYLAAKQVAGAPVVAYTPITPANWSPAAPTNVQDAIDRMAALLKILNAGNPIP